MPSRNPPPPWYRCGVTVWSAGRDRQEEEVPGFLASRRLLHDADAAVQLALRVVVVDVGVAATHVGRGHGRQAAALVGTAVLEQDVHTLLAARPPGVGQRRLTASITALHVHAVLEREGWISGKHNISSAKLRVITIFACLP